MARTEKGTVGKTPAFTQEQAERIIAQPDVNTEMGRRDRVLLLLLFFCGLRRGEVVKVEAGDFFENQGHQMLGVHGKGRSDKADAVLIPPQIWPEIRDYIENRKGLLFTGASSNGNYNRKEKPISPTRVYLLFQKYCRRAGLDPMTMTSMTVQRWDDEAKELVTETRTTNLPTPQPDAVSPINPSAIKSMVRYVN